MEWSARYTAENAPDLKQIRAFVANPLWDKLFSYIEETFALKCFIEYSGCGMAPGWNVKFRKSGRNLCTLYPTEGGFACLVIASDKDLLELELLLPTWSDYVRELFQNTKSFMGGRWLMVAVESDEILEDLKDLLRIRWNKK